MTRKKKGYLAPCDEEEFFGTDGVEESLSADMISSTSSDEMTSEPSLPASDLPYLLDPSFIDYMEDHPSSQTEELYAKNEHRLDSLLLGEAVSEAVVRLDLNSERSHPSLNKKQEKPRVSDRHAPAPLSDSDASGSSLDSLASGGELGISADLADGARTSDWQERPDSELEDEMLLDKESLLDSLMACADDSSSEDAALMSALQEMADSDSEEMLLDKESLLDSLMSCADGSLLEDDELMSALQEMASGSTEREEPGPVVLSSLKQSLLDSLLPSDEERHLTGRYGVLAEESAEELDEESSILGATVSEPEPEPEIIPAIDKVVAETEIEDAFVPDAGIEIGSAALVSGAVVAREPLVVPCKAVHDETIAGLMLWEDCATVCLMGSRRGKLIITHAGHLEFPDKAGDSERLQLIRALWKKAKIPTRSVWVSVHVPSLSQKFSTYDLTGEQLEKVLMHDAEQSMQGVGGSAAIDWHMRSRSQGGSEGMVFAMPGWERDHYVDMLRKAGLYVCGMSVPACDLARILEIARPYPDRKRRPAECIISFSRTGADIVIVYGMGSFYSRTVYSRVASWRDNMHYLYECINDAINHFTGWVGHQPVCALLLTGNVPDLADLGGELLRETGIYAEVWNPVHESAHIELSAFAVRSGISGTMLAGCAGLAMVRD